MDGEGLWQKGVDAGERLLLVSLAPPSPLGAPSPRIHPREV